jgi:YVTN family beta-propeller protein
MKFSNEKPMKAQKMIRKILSNCPRANRYADRMVFLTALLLSGHAKAEPQFEVKSHIHIGGAGRWDYLNFEPKSRRLFVTQGNRVVVIDCAKEAVVGAVEGLNGTHGVVFDTARNHGFVTNAGDSSVKVFDLKTLKVVASVPTSQGPDGMVWDPTSQQVISFNGRSGSATFIDAKTLQVSGTLALGGKPEFPVSDGKGFVFDNLEDKSEVVKIDTKTRTIVGRYNLAPNEGPSGLAIDTRNEVTFSTCDGAMAVLDGKTGTLIASPKIDDGPDAACFDPKLGLAFSSNGSGTLSVIAKTGAGYETVETVATAAGARTMAIDPDRHILYAAAAKMGPIEPGQRRAPALPDTFEILVIGIKK